MATQSPSALAGARHRDGRDLVVPAVLGLSGVAWVLLWWWSLGGGGHHHTAALDAAGVPRALLLGLGWLAMVAAMMLPLAVHLLQAVGRLVRHRARPGPLVAAAGAGFFLPWLVTGQLLYLADLSLDAGLARVDWLGSNTGVVAGAAVAGAGAFQLSGLKRRSLAACRSPVGFAARYWQGGSRPARDALRIGTAYGLSCVACCWALMVLMVGAAAAGLLAMVFFGAVMFIERLTPWGLAFARWTGVVLLPVGVIWAVAAALA